MTRVALQLWTVREECARDFEGSLRRIGEIGFDGVELFNLDDREASEVRALCDDAGLAVAGMHVPLGHDAADVAAALSALGADRAAIAWIDPDALDVAPVRDASEAAHAAGFRLGFHNHWTEPVGAPSFLDRLRELPEELLWLELDLGWVWRAGADPLAELAATSGRCPLVHLKDYVGEDDVPVGDGEVGYERVVPAALAAGAEWLVVEEDDVGPEPWLAVERSLRNVRALLA
jgi:sugar phosphate isomerase/epimerase